MSSEKGTVYIGRGSVFGNPYTHLPSGRTRALYKVKTREESIKMYEAYARRMLGNSIAFRKAVEDLRPYDILECFCHPLPCHGGVIIRLWEELNLGQRR